MSDTFPHRSKNARHHEIEEEVLKDNSDTLEVISIHIHSRNAANDTTNSNKKHPVPLPSTSYRMKPLFIR